MKNKILLCIFIFVLSLFLVQMKERITYAPSSTYEIYSSSDLVNAAKLSKVEGHQDTTFILKNDITISDEDQNTLTENNESISFGSSDFPFSGTFEGNGYTINKLKYSSTLSPRYDTGLFSYTNGATIRNLTINDSEIYSDYRGGIVVGSATNTLIENVNVTNSHLFVSAIDNVITLITDGGIRGGAIVGEANNSVLYNCESNNTIVNTNSTSGVAALAGKGLTLGGLIGISNNSTVEYSRVIGGKVSNYYDVAVGAVGGNVLYVGGVVGQMNGTSKVIDSFSTSELYYYCGTYVSVGAGNIGHIGGITAAMNETTNEIYRSHYAGVATSRQYNAALVIPIIQNNVNISGIADVYDGGAVVNSYFKPSLNPDVKMNVLGSSSSTTSYGPLDDSKYIDKEYFQDQSWDFTGTIRRNTEYNNNHHNKWVIDMNNGIPVHGKSISATFNFPNSGSVSIASSSLVNSNVTTSNPYIFAVQGYKPSEVKTSISANLNANYKFISWYKVSDVYATALDNDNEFFVNVFDNNNAVSNDREYNNFEFLDNDLYIARIKAKVSFHDVDGHVIDETGNQVLHYENYYDYLDKLPDVTPNSNLTSTFIGWTTIPYNGNHGYDGITNTELNNIKSQNAFYEAGAEITKPLDLYPIYVDLLSNIHVIFEGNELDSNSDVSLREGVGNATITKNAANETITLGINGANNGSLPDGYRFLGWYNEDGNRISKDASYTFAFSDIDLTETTTFIARFEYRVDYYVRAFTQNNGNNFTNSKLYNYKWMRYQDNFENLSAPGYMHEYITHWGLNDHVNHGKTNVEDGYSGIITSPLSVYSHNYNSQNIATNNYQVQVESDFPNAGTILEEGSNLTFRMRFTPYDNDRYHFMFWTLERTEDDKKWTYVNNPMDSGNINSSSNYRGMAMITTDLLFYKKDDSVVKTTRRYKSNVFINQDEEYTYKYPIYHPNDVVSDSTYDGGTIKTSVTLNASPSNASMELNDYYFVGWISSTDVKYESSEWNYIYDVVGDKYTSSSIKKVLPYIVDSNMLVEETMDLYPVYVKYNIETTTSLAGITTTEVNKPINPTYTIVKSADGSGVVTIVPDEETLIKNGEEALYELDYLSVIKDDGEEEIITKDSNGEYKYNIVAGPNYKFIANYIPYVLVYHINTNNLETKIYNKNDQIGEQPNPTFTVDSNYLFVGWTKSIPTSNYHTFESYTDFENSNVTLITPSMLVTDSYELYPVYVKHNITLNSNIDTYLDNLEIARTSVYSLKRNDLDTMDLVIKTPKLNNYYFAGWYENYVDNSNLGTLISTDVSYKLAKADNYNSKVYTAVFKEVYEIRYHNVNGNILETIYVKEDDNRSFVTNSIDSNNNPIEVPIDSNVYTNIYNYLSKNEYIKEFSQIKSDNTIVPWDDYKNNIITSDMDLYPIIYVVTAKDSNDQNISLTTSNPRIVTAMTKESFLAKFTGDYTEPKLTIHVEENMYTRNDVTVRNVSSKEVNLFKNEETLDILASENTDGRGNAVFNLKVKLTLTKNNNATKNSDDIFIFTITNNDTGTIKKVTIASNSSIIIELPYGNYTISEDNNWAWRYNSYSINKVLNNNSINTLIVDNVSNNNKWFDNTEYNNNSYEVTP